MNQRAVKQMRIYACGGMAQNVARLFKERKHSEGAADIHFVYVDTSKSNLQGLEDEDVYLIKSVEGTELDGGGKIRRDNVESITNAAADILQQYKPMDINIVLGSAAGASGSTIGPVLTNNLLTKGALTIVITVGNTTSHVEATNTLNTLKSYEGVSQATKVPVPIVYFQNTNETPRATVNEIIRSMIVQLTVLFSGQNDELDSRDLHNWLRYDHSTTHEPRLTMLNILDKEGLTKVDLGNVISVATLSSKEVDHEPHFYSEYRCNGFVPDHLKPAMEKCDPLFYILSDGPVNAVYITLRDTVKSLDEARNSRKQVKAIVDDNDNVTHGGLVL